MDALQLFVCEAKAVPLRKMSRVYELRHEMERLRQELTRDAQVMEFLSLRTKTPYVQFFMTKQFARQHASDVSNAVPNSLTASVGAISSPFGAEAQAGLTTASTTSPTDGVGSGGGATAGGGAVSTFAAPSNEPTSLPPE